MADERRSSPTEEVQRLYEQTESRTARAFEELVSRQSFGELLARMTENVVGVTKITTDMLDLTLRNLRLAGRQDITRLSRQLARTEDKLELVLQQVERVQAELRSVRDGEQAAARSSRSSRRAGSSDGRTGARGANGRRTRVNAGNSRTSGRASSRASDDAQDSDAAEQR